VSARDAKLAELEAELAGLRHEFEQGGNHAATLAEELSARDAHLAELEAALAGVRQEADQVRGDAERLTETVNTREGSIAALEDELAALRQTATHGQDEAARLVETLSVRDGELAAREGELAALRSAYEHRSEQAARFAQRARERSERIAQLESPETAKAQPDDEPPTTAPAGYVVFAQLAQRYALVECDGAVPAEDARLELPDIDAGLLRVVGFGRSPLPNDPRSCVFAECVYESAWPRHG
jgi:DNA repair exonuclease SbcCD ATPase subunit